MRSGQFLKPSSSLYHDYTCPDVDRIFLDIYAGIRKIMRNYLDPDDIPDVLLQDMRYMLIDQREALKNQVTIPFREAFRQAMNDAWLEVDSVAECGAVEAEQLREQLAKRDQIIADLEAEIDQLNEALFERNTALIMAG